MDLTQVLEATISADKNELEVAQKYLESAAVSNLQEFMAALSNILVDPSKTQVARTAAGLQLKNYLTSKDPEVRAKYQQQWFEMAENIRTHIKTNVLNTLGTEAGLSSAAQCIAGIALAELPTNRWPELIKTLSENVTNDKSTEKVKEASLEAIGYICQDVDSQFLSGDSEIILRAIVTGMKPEETNNVKYAATSALLNSLEFTRSVFEKEMERNIIMTFVCQATQCTDKKVKVAGLQCLVKIVSLYYELMEAYMGPALFAITIDAMKSDEDEVVLQGIEFWSSVCDEEVDLSLEASEAQENSIPPAHVSRFYAKGALQYLVPILLTTLTKQEEFDDDDDWCPSKSAGVCLMLLSSCCGNDVVPYVLPFVTEHIKNTDWKYRDGAVMAFGSILEGPEPDDLRPIVLEAMPILLELMKDPSVVVRDSTAWTMSRICEQVPEAALDEANLENLLNVLLESLQSEPRVACNVCWAFSSLADAAYENTPSEDEDGPMTYCLSGKFQFIVERLLQTGERHDASQSNLRSAAYEAVMELVKNSPKDCYETVQKTVVAILDRINKILAMERSGASIGDHSQHNDFKSLLCATLQSALRKLQSNDAAQISDACVTALLQMLSVSKVGGVQEDAFMAIGVLIEAVGEKFVTYMQVFNPFLLAGLRNRAEYQVCISAVGVVGDLSRAIGIAILPYCNDYMQIFMECLADLTVHRSVKPHVLSVFGDIALAIGPQFKMYAQLVLQTLNQASNTQVDKSDYDMLDYLNDLREACLESYTGIVQGLKGEDEKNVNPEVKDVGEHVNHIINFIETIAQDADRTDTLVGGCCGLLGDLCSAFGNEMMVVMEKQTLQDLLQEGRRSKTSKTKTLAMWTSKIARNLRK